YTEHAENVALALRVCADLDVPRETALRGMWQAAPDPGAMAEHRVDFFGREILFVNGFAANDPVSTERIWRLSLARRGAGRRTIAVFNCRADRPDRSLQLGTCYARWPAADHLVVMGTGTYLFARAAAAAGADAAAAALCEGLAAREVFERIVGLCGARTLVMGMGNIGGSGLELAQHFRNRAVLEEEHRC
ncbi:MAG: poly-gamma-glutamate synthase PgsB, partial [Deltaproteobacteria bacterium]|nr:poly-gamma-glutamate synthase PgsB [Deltaproteobacteria bacterium]